MTKVHILEDANRLAPSCLDEEQRRLKCSDFNPQPGQWRIYRKQTKITVSPFSTAAREELMSDHLLFDAWLEAYERRFEPVPLPVQNKTGCYK